MNSDCRATRVCTAYCQAREHRESLMRFSCKKDKLGFFHNLKPEKQHGNNNQLLYFSFLLMIHFMSNALLSHYLHDHTYTGALTSSLLCVVPNPNWDIKSNCDCWTSDTIMQSAVVMLARTKPLANACAIWPHPMKPTRGGLPEQQQQSHMWKRERDRNCRLDIPPFNLLSSISGCS